MGGYEREGESVMYCTVSCIDIHFSLSPLHYSPHTLSISLFSFLPPSLLPPYLPSSFPLSLLPSSLPSSHLPPPSLPPPSSLLPPPSLPPPSVPPFDTHRMRTWPGLWSGVTSATIHPPRPHQGEEQEMTTPITPASLQWSLSTRTCSGSTSSTPKRR